MTNKTLQVIFSSCLAIYASNIYAQDCYTNIESTGTTTNFVIQNGGIVTDQTTGLSWLRCPLGTTFVAGVPMDQCVGTPSMPGWQNALSSVDDVLILGYSDWHIPNIKELSTIVAWNCYNPAINQNIFPNMNIDNVWSSTVLPNSYLVWSINYKQGLRYTTAKDSEMQVMLVRRN